MGRNIKEWGGIKRNGAEYKGMGRNIKEWAEYQGMGRNKKEWDRI